MAVYKQQESKFWWYKFTWNGQSVRRSTKQTNKRVAEQMEAAHKTGLAKGEVGIVEKQPAPTLELFAERFMQAISVRSAEKPRTVAFYQEKLNRLLEYPKMARATIDAIDAIDEALIEEYVKERRKQVAPATVNRQLATLRRALRLAHEWKVIDRVPRIRLLQGERTREFVLTREVEAKYLEAVPEPLADIAILMLDTGLRDGEALALKWSDVHMEPAGGAKFGYLQVQKGKSAKARRTLSLTARAVTMLTARSKTSTSEFVFCGRLGKPILVTSLDHQHSRVRESLKLPADFVVHSLRHTMLTRLGLLGVDAFTIMKIAGHSSITVSQRYVHPSPESVERAFEKLEESRQGVARIGVGIELGIGEKLSDPKIAVNC
jgi:integrase